MYRHLQCLYIYETLSTRRIQWDIVTSYTTIQKDQLSKIGTHLKESREQQEKSIEDISLQTYIRPQLIKAIESCIPADLPQPIFVQGFIRRYAEALGLDGVGIAKQFPVHSIPDTPRPTPQPASKPSMFSSEAMANPVVVASPRPAPKKRAISTTTSRSVVVPSEPVASVPAPAASEESPETSTASSSVIDKPDTSTPASSSASASTDMTATATSPPLAGSPAESSAPVADTEIPAATSAPLGQSVPSYQDSMSTSIPAASYSESGSSNVLPNRMPYLLAGAIALGGVVAIALISTLGGGQNSEEAQAPEAPEAPAVVEAPAPPPEPEPEVISEAPVYLQVEVTEAGPSWMRITVDGSVAYEGLVQPGEQKLWEGQNQIAVNVGNAGAALLSVNGADPQPAGQPGAASQKTFTPESQ